MNVLQTTLAVLVVGLFTLIGLPMAAAGTFVFLQRCFLTVFGERTTGEIVGLVDNKEAKPSEKSATESSAFLQILFFDCYGKEHQVTTDTSVSPKRYHRGDQVPLLYRLTRPETFVVDRFWIKWTLPLTFSGVGLILLIPLLLAISHAWPW